jgi:predicted methyltransferase
LLRVRWKPFYRRTHLDLVLIHLNYHDLEPAVRVAMNKEFSPRLKAASWVVDHSAKDGSGNEAVKTLHRIDRLLVIRSHGLRFILAKGGTCCANPRIRVTSM